MKVKNRLKMLNGMFLIPIPDTIYVTGFILSTALNGKDYELPSTVGGRIDPISYAAGIHFNVSWHNITPYDFTLRYRLLI